MKVTIIRAVSVLLIMCLIGALLPFRSNAAPAHTAVGIDVSYYQGNINWDKVATQIDFAIIRCGYGKNTTGQDDKKWHDNAAACTRLGIPFGVYLYSYATTDAQALSEAEHVLRLVKGYNLSLPIYLDLEDKTILASCSKEDILRHARIFCEAIEAAGYSAGIYASYDWWKNYLTSAEYDKWDRWIARYNSYTGYDKAYSIWQYTDKGSIQGISGNVDMNYWYGTFPPNGSPCNCSDAYAGQYICTTSSKNLNIRKDHSTSSAVVESIPSGAVVTVTKASGTGPDDWGHVTYNGKSGYASMAYLKKEENKVFVSESNVRLDIAGDNNQIITVSYSNTSEVSRLYMKCSVEGDCFSYKWGSWDNHTIPLNLTGIREGRGKAVVEMFDWNTNELLATTTVDITVTAPTYKVTYHANGGSNAPGNQSKKHNVELTLSSAKPVRNGYTFCGWAETGSATAAKYQPGGTYSGNADITLYAVWKKGCEGDSHKYAYKVSATPTTSASGKLTGTCEYCGAATSVTLPKLNTTDYTYAVTKEPTYTAAGTGTYTWKNTGYGKFVFDVALDKLVPELTGITVKKAPDKTVYEIGQVLDTTGLILEAAYSDGSTRQITGGFTTSGFDSVAEGTKTIRVTFEGKSATFQVTIKKASPALSAQLVIEKMTAVPGQTVEVKISLKNSPGLASMLLKVAYDNGLSLREIRINEALGGQFTTSKELASPVSILWINVQEEAKGDVLFATLVFQVSESAKIGDSFRITAAYDADDIYNLNEEAVFLSVEDGGVSVSSRTPGDINGDGKVNNRDATRLLQHLAGWDVEYAEGSLDVNNDGKVNNRDATRLLQYLAGWDVDL